MRHNMIGTSELLVLPPTTPICCGSGKGGGGDFPTMSKSYFYVVCQCTFDNKESFKSYGCGGRERDS